MNCFLIDFENVSADSIKDLSGVQKGDALVVFYSENHKSITLDILNSILELKLKYSGFKVKDTSSLYRCVRNCPSSFLC